MGIGHWLKLGNDISVLNGVLVHFIAAFSFFLVFFGCISLLVWHFRLVYEQTSLRASLVGLNTVGTTI